MTQPNARCQDAGHKLGEITARKITSALEAIHERLAHLDGSPAGGSADGGSRSTDTTSTTERAALRRHSLCTYREDLRDAIADACNTIRLLDELADAALRHAGHTVEAVDAPTCADGQVGREGVETWGEQCYAHPTKAGMCAKHYQRSYVWRRAANIDTSKDYEAA